LEPVGSGEYPDRGGHRGVFIGLDFQPDAVIELKAQEMVDDVEAVFARGIVDAANIDQAAEQAARIIAQIAQNVGDLVAVDLQRQLAERNVPAGYCLLLRLRQSGAELFQLLFHSAHLRAVQPFSDPSRPLYSFSAPAASFSLAAHSSPDRCAGT